MLNNNRGISLVSLVITIVVLLIIAGVSINAFFGGDGIINKTKKSVNIFENAQNYSQTIINDIKKEITNNYIENGNIEEKEELIQEIGSLTEFSYKGTCEEYLVQDTGYYKLECWGAQGAGSHQNGELGYAGRGGYSVGEIFLQKGEKLYVYVGGQGSARNSAGTVAGGYNGGGYGWKNTGGSSDPAASGGGATDIRLKSGEWNNSESLLSRIIVAGGGGGGGMDGETAGAGGGTSGGSGNASGGTQTSGHAFGYGADATTGNGSNSTYGGPGAGGGWYGGSVSSWKGAGGGSGFVLNSATISNVPTGYFPTEKYYLSNSYTIAGTGIIPSVDGGEEQGHTGNGYVKINFIIK